MTIRILTTALLASVLGFAGCSGSSDGFGGDTTDSFTEDASGGDDFGNPDAGSDPSPDNPADEGGNEGEDDSLADKSINPAAPDASGPEGANPVPEPATMLLFGIGATGVALRRRRRPAGPVTAQDDSTQPATL